MPLQLMPNLVVAKDHYRVCLTSICAMRRSTKMKARLLNAMPHAAHAMHTARNDSGGMGCMRSPEIWKCSSAMLNIEHLIQAITLVLKPLNANMLQERIGRNVWAGNIAGCCMLEMLAVVQGCLQQIWRLS